NEIVDVRAEQIRLSGASTEEKPRVSHRCRARAHEKRHQSMAHARIVTDTIVGAQICRPKPSKTWRLGPESMNVVSIVLQDDPAARRRRSDQFTDNRRGVGDML